MHLKDIGEFGFIKRIEPDSINDTRNVLRSIGDDAAVFRVGKTSVLFLPLICLWNGCILSKKQCRVISLGINRWLSI